MSEKIEHVLAQSIDDITAGRASLEDVLKQHPGLRNELEPLLRLALGLREASNQVGPSLAFRSKAKAQLMEAISAQSPRRGLLHLPLGNIWKGERRQGMVFKIATAIAALLVVLGIGGGTAYAAQDAQFGDLLYPVKTATEQARLVLSTTASGKAASHLDIAQSRLDELTNATVNGKSDVAHTLATQYRSHVLEALSWAAQASDNRSEQATLRLQERLEAHLSAMEALGQEMPNVSEGNGQVKGSGKPEGVGKPEDVGQSEEAGRTTVGECIYAKTGDQNRYQVWCSGAHITVNLEGTVQTIQAWWAAKGLPAAANDAAGDEAAAASLIDALEIDPLVEHFNFYGPLSRLNTNEPDEPQGVGKAEGTGKTATDGCVYMQTGKQKRYQVWCNGVHLIVNLEGTAQTIQDWWTAKVLPTAANNAASNESAAASLITALETDPLVEHFNFYGPLSKIKANGPSDLAEQEQEQIQAGGQTKGKGPKSK